ncbi:MAG: fumarylacetoacetate hydrolase family protein [Gammaproteobacteria bacterium]|nr:fumarylacetoacetate hydrolase family protein [Gammaproteobacteria bacterium]
MVDSVIDAANWLFQSRLKKTVHENLPDTCYPDTTELAYRVQDQLVSKIISSRDSRRIGYKIGCTNQQIMELLGTDEPFYGCIFSDSTYSSDAILSASDFTHRIVEAEFMLVMGNDLPFSNKQYDAESIEPFIEALIPAIEIVDHRFTNFTQVGANALISDNGIHAASILGELDVEKWKSMNLASQRVRLFVNDTLKEAGTGANVLGNPLNAMAWLANCLQLQGKTLQEGELVSTGAFCPIYSALAGDRISADFGVLGRVNLKFLR